MDHERAMMLSTILKSHQIREKVLNTIHKEILLLLSKKIWEDPDIYLFSMWRIDQELIYGMTLRNNSND